MCHGQAALRGFSVSKEVHVSNIQEIRPTAIQLVSSSLLAEKMQVADFVIKEELLSFCCHASNRYRMYLMDRNTENKETAKRRKRMVLQELLSAKKRKGEFEIVSKKLIDTTDQKVKEAEKRKDVTHLKALVIEPNASREKSEKIQKKGMPA